MIELCGAACFVVGSVFFVLSAYAVSPEDAHDQLRIGCAVWIPGCVCYLWQPLPRLLGKRSTYSDTLQTLIMLLFIVGCSMVFLPHAAAVNGLFLAGSFLAFADGARNALLAQRRDQSVLVSPAPESPSTATESAQAGKTDGSQEKGQHASMVNLQLQLLGGLAFTAAAVGGGYSSDAAVVEAAMWLWLLGSALYLASAATTTCLFSAGSGLRAGF
jgi:hypothetical protein